MARSSRHWYVYGASGQLEEAHSLGIKEARQKKAFISPTTVIQEVRATPFHLMRWQRQQLVNACIDSPPRPNEPLAEYYERVNEMSFRRSDEATYFGKKIHTIAEHYPAQQLDPALESWYIYIRDWFDTHVSQDLAQEERIADTDIGVAGTLDRRIVTLTRGELAIVDFKTQGIKDRIYYGDSWPKQLSFYANATRKKWALPCNPKCINVVIDSTAPNPCITKEWSDEEINDAYRDFLSETWLWSRDNRHWPCGLWDLSHVLQSKHLCP